MQRAHGCQSYRATPVGGARVIFYAFELGQEFIRRCSSWAIDNQAQRSGLVVVQQQDNGMEKARTPYFIGGNEQFARGRFVIGSAVVRNDTTADCQDGQQTTHGEVSIEQQTVSAALSRAFRSWLACAALLTRGSIAPCPVLLWGSGPGFLASAATRTLAWTCGSLAIGSLRASLSDWFRLDAGVRLVAGEDHLFDFGLQQALDVKE